MRNRFSSVDVINPPRMTAAIGCSISRTTLPGSRPETLQLTSILREPVSCRITLGAGPIRRSATSPSGTLAPDRNASLLTLKSHAAGAARNFSGTHDDNEKERADARLKSPLAAFLLFLLRRGGTGGCARSIRRQIPLHAPIGKSSFDKITK